MYILLNLDSLEVLHKHANPIVLANIAWIECDADYSIFPIGGTEAFKFFTDMELKVLYKNLTAKDAPNFRRHQLLSSILCNVRDIVVSDINAQEVELQARTIKEDARGQWHYVNGSFMPARKEDIFKWETGNNKAAYAPSTLRSKGDQQVTSTQVRGSVCMQPKRGTIKAIIWNIADEIWEENKKPTDKKEVLSLRKIIMDKLELHNISRISASTELGKWHKVRAPY